MTIKQKKEFLNSYKLINSEINRLLSECESYRELARKITPTYSDTPKSQNTNSKIEIAVEKITTLENEINNKIDELLVRKEQVEKAISTVNNKVLEEILKRKYINCQTWEQIVVEMNYCYMHICRLHGQALNKML